VHYADFDVVLPTSLPRTFTSTTLGPDAAESKTTSKPAQALEAFNRLTEHEKKKVLGYLRAAHPHNAVQETEGEEVQKLMMLAVVLLLLFTFCFYVALALTGSPTR